MPLELLKPSNRHKPIEVLKPIKNQMPMELSSKIHLLKEINMASMLIRNSYQQLIVLLNFHKAMVHLSNLQTMVVPCKDSTVLTARTIHTGSLLQTMGKAPRSNLAMVKGNNSLSPSAMTLPLVYGLPARLRAKNHHPAMAPRNRILTVMVPSRSPLVIDSLKNKVQHIRCHLAMAKQIRIRLTMAKVLTKALRIRSHLDKDQRIQKHQTMVSLLTKAKCNQSLLAMDQSSHNQLAMENLQTRAQPIGCHLAMVKRSKHHKNMAS